MKSLPPLSKQVHDFGFFRYDPDAIKYHKYNEIPLAPEAASVGLEIRVVGNDSGEQVIVNYIGGGFVAPESIIQVADK